MKDNFGDGVKVGVRNAQIDIDLYDSDAGIWIYSPLTPAKARKLARKLNRAAFEVDGKQCRRGRQVKELQDSLAGLSDLLDENERELRNAKREIDHLQREAAAKDVHRIGDVRSSSRTGETYRYIGGETTTPWMHLASGNHYSWDSVLVESTLVERNGVAVERAA